MAILSLDQLIKRFNVLASETKRALKDHEAKINSIDMDDLAAVRRQLNELVARVAKLERQIKP